MRLWPGMPFWAIGMPEKTLSGSPNKPPPGKLLQQLQVWDPALTAHRISEDDSESASSMPRIIMLSAVEGTAARRCLHWSLPMMMPILRPKEKRGHFTPDVLGAPCVETPHARNQIATAILWQSSIDKGLLDEDKVHKTLGYEIDQDANGRASDGLTDEERMERIRKLSAPGSGHPYNAQEPQDEEEEEGKPAKKESSLRAKFGFAPRRPSNAKALEQSMTPGDPATYNAIGYVASTTVMFPYFADVWL
ncbi:hypothetical protein N7468_007229 [Penicillium chermesinum]|uniref:Uncharacterized protein n=1 Tax=Penicillium chermesinum TaxID=63820 RepID=A0A9W9NTT6_9EURO|nr:uncharacterized protein N7468_007229 [Penicillium chermesinum]KAJ5226004.1 hypothetical protein N7468_007229 [Penicillium chermesinum]